MSRRAELSLGPDGAAASLHEIAWFERATAHLLAGWVPKVPDLAVKVQLGELLYQAIVRAGHLRSRAAGLSRATAAAHAARGGWLEVMRQVDASTSPGEMLGRLTRVVRPGLAALYRRHLETTDPLGDGASVALLTSLLPELDAPWAGKAARLGEEAAPAAIDETAELWARRSEGPELPEGEPLWGPLDRVPEAARAADLPRCLSGSLGILTVDSVREPEDLTRFLHAELDEEYVTLELIARNSYEHPEMPWAFHVDMARQAADEARHARMMEKLLEDRGRRHGDFPVSTGSYDGLYQFAPCEAGSRRELLWRMLIRQTFMEGLALDSLAHDLERRAGQGQDDVVRALDYVLRDELFHVQSGTRWSMHLLGGDGRAVLQERYEALTWYEKAAEAARERFVHSHVEEALGELAVLEEGKRRRGGLPPARPVNRLGRLQAGQSADDILQVLSWGYATEEGFEPPRR